MYIETTKGAVRLVFGLDPVEVRPEYEEFHVRLKISDTEYVRKIFKAKEEAELYYKAVRDKLLRGD